MMSTPPPPLPDEPPPITDESEYEEIDHLPRQNGSRRGGKYPLLCHKYTKYCLFDFMYSCKLQ